MQVSTLLNRCCPSVKKAKLYLLGCGESYQRAPSNFNIHTHAYHLGL